MGYVQDAEPIVVYHDLNGPLQDEFYRLLGEFITKYTAAEEDIIRSVRGFLTLAASGGLETHSIIHIITAAAPIGALMDVAIVVAEEVCQFSEADLSKLKQAKARFDLQKSFRNLLAHQSANLSPYTELPFAIDKTASEQRLKNFRTIFIGTEALVAAIHDAPLAGYLFRLALGREAVSEEDAPNWQYSPSLLTHHHWHSK